MRLVSERTRSGFVAVLVLIVALIVCKVASAGESSGHSPFGILERDGFAAITRPGTAEHEAFFARPEETTSGRSGAAERSGLPGDIVFAGPILPAGQEIIAPPAIIAPSAPLIAAPVPPSTLEQDPFPRPPLEEVAHLKARARELLANGSIASARALLESAASGGDAESEYLLAQTYDPEALTRFGMVGIKADAGKAEAFYRAAKIGGYPNRASPP